MFIRAMATALLLSTSALAGTWQIGKPTMVRTVACDTQDQITSVISAHVEHGMRAGREAFQTLALQRNDQNEPVCGQVQGVYAIVNVIATHEGLEGFPAKMNVVTMMSPQGRVLYGLWEGDIVQQLGQAI